MHEIFGVMERAQHPITMHEQFTLVYVHQGLERLLIARLSGEHQQGSVMVDLVVDAVALHLDERSCAPCQAFAATPTTRLADLFQQLIGERRKVRPLSLVLLDSSPAGTSGHGMPRLKARRSSQRFSAR